MFVLVAHFATALPGQQASPTGTLPAGAEQPLSLLAASPQCRRLRFAQSTDVAGRYVLVAEFDSAAAYRRCLAGWDMRTEVAPWLSTAEVDVSGVHEVLFRADGGRVETMAPTVPDPGR